MCQHYGARYIIMQAVIKDAATCKHRRFEKSPSTSILNPLANDINGSVTTAPAGADEIRSDESLQGLPFRDPLLPTSRGSSTN